MRSFRWLLLTLFLTGLVASVQALALESESQYVPDPYLEPVPSGLTSDQVVQAHVDNVMIEQAQQAKANASQAVQMDNNTYDIAEMQRMTGTQDFILKLVAIIMPLLIAMMTGVMLYIQIKQKQVGEIRSVEQREDLILVARSVNGMKTELVAKSELAAFLEAMTMAENGKMTQNAEIRLAELQEAVRYATEKANAVASKAIVELTAKQRGRTPVAQTVPLAHGEQKIMEGVDFGEEPVNHDAIAVATGQVKNVVGVPT